MPYGRIFEAIRPILLLAVVHLSRLLAWVALWAIANPGRAFLATFGTLFLIWLMRQVMAVEYTSRMLSWAGIPEWIFFVFIVGFGLLAAFGEIEPRSPFDDVRRRRERRHNDEEPR